MPDGTEVHAFSRRPRPELTVGDYMDAHAASVETLAAEMPIDILAHPTLVTLAFRRVPTDELWTEEHEARIVEALFNAPASHSRSRLATRRTNASFGVPRSVEFASRSARTDIRPNKSATSPHRWH